MWLIEGVEQGRFATLMKSHHCLMDGMAGAGLGEILCDLEAHPKAGPAGRAVPRTPAVSDLEMGWRAARHVAAMPSRLARMGGRLLRQGAVMAVGALRSDPAAPPLPTSVPATPFNRAIGPRRAFACASVPLAAVKAVKKHFDVTVNDVILAITGTAIAGYLRGRGELPERPLVALIAVSTREEGDTSVDNRVTTVPVNWATDVQDPVQRLRRIHRNAERAKQVARHHDADLLSGLGGAVPPGLTNLAMRSIGTNLSVLARIGNVVVSNVRATPVPLYTAGARIESMYPMSVLASGQGLNVTVVSYMGRVDVGFTADPDLVPDVWELADAIPAALAELSAALDRSAARRAA
jgi:WS/DGAT/MGAT family acyltransferase